MFIKRREKNLLIDYLLIIDNVFKGLEDFNSIKKKKTLIVFDNMIVNMEANEKLSPIIAELLGREKIKGFTTFYITILFQSA